MVKTKVKIWVVVVCTVISVAVISTGSLVFISKTIASTQYEQRDYKNALTLYQVHYFVYRDNESLIGVCESAFALDEFETLLDYSQKLKPEMFVNEKEYGVMLANYLISILMTQPEDDYSYFFQEYRRLSPMLIDYPSFFRPFTTYVLSIDLDTLMRLMTAFIQEKIPLMKVDKLKASAYTLLAVAYDRLDQHDKALDMMEIASQLDLLDD